MFGIYDKNQIGVVQSVYHALYALQHRGQESCGIAINKRGVITGYKGLGLVNEVFTKDVLDSLKEGEMAIGTNAYGTEEDPSATDALPLIVNHSKGNMALASNGSLTNAAELREELEEAGAIFHTNTHAEVIAYEITQERLHSTSIENAIDKAMDKLKGAYCLVVLSPRKLIAARDPNGFHPLCIGTIGESFVVASETCALDAVGATYLRDVDPGEIVICDANGLRSLRTHCDKTKKSLCVFEYVYFSRPDSVVDGSSVHNARRRAGAFLALRHPTQADVVIGVPDSGLDAALGFAQQSGIPYGVGFIKNKYIGRTFIQPTQQEREHLVRIKLNPIEATVRGKRVVLVDDSIVRGTTSARIVRLLRSAGAREVHMRISSPPFLYPCYFGTDVASVKSLIAYQHSVEEIAKIIGVDSLGYLTKEDVMGLAENGGSFCTACFDGEYPVAPPQKEQKNRYREYLPENTQD